MTISQTRRPDFLRRRQRKPNSTALAFVGFCQNAKVKSRIFIGKIDHAI